jgi:hypothetical protein
LPKTKPAAALPSAGARHRDGRQPAADGATIDVRLVGAAGGVIIELAGTVGRNDAAILSSRLHSEIDRAPTMIVVNLNQIESGVPALREVLTLARTRACIEGVTLYVVDPRGLTGLAAPPADGTLAADRLAGPR